MKQKSPRVTFNRKGGSFSKQLLRQLDARILGNPFYRLTIVQSIKLLLTVYRVPVSSAMAVGSHVRFHFSKRQILEKRSLRWNEGIAFD